MADEDAQSGAVKSKGKKAAATAVDGNAPGGDAFRSPDNPMASGGDAVLGNQVEARNQALGLTPDPGPVMVGEGHDTLNWRNPGKGETLNGVNDGVSVTQRHSTAPDYFSRDGNTSDTKLGAHVIGLESKASDMYNPAGRDTDGYPQQSAEHFSGKQASGADGTDPFVQTADGEKAGAEPVSV